MSHLDITNAGPRRPRLTAVSYALFVMLLLVLAVLLAFPSGPVVPKGDPLPRPDRLFDEGARTFDLFLGALMAALGAATALTFVRWWRRPSRELIVVTLFASAVGFILATLTQWMLVGPLVVVVGVLCASVAATRRSVAR